jgi:GNAT superfamily N-acetyltransferase
VPVRPATIDDYAAIVADLPAFWGDRDVRHAHHPIVVREFGDTAVVHDGDDGVDSGVDGYLFGFVTPARLGYVHAVAVRGPARGTGVARLLYEAFTGTVRARGAVGLKAITTVGNAASIAFHRRLGFSAEVVADYGGPGEPRVVFHRGFGAATAGRPAVPS